MFLWRQQQQQQQLSQVSGVHSIVPLIKAERIESMDSAWIVVATTIRAWYEGIREVTSLLRFVYTIIIRVGPHGLRSHLLVLHKCVTTPLTAESLTVLMSCKINSLRPIQLQIHSVVLQ